MAAYSSWLYPAYKRISRLIGDKYYTYAKLGTNGNVGDGIDYGQALVVSNSKTTMFEWNYFQSAAPVGPVAWTFGIDTDFDGVANLNGNNAQITDASGAVLCTAISNTTTPIKGVAGGFSNDAIFPTECIRKTRQIADVHMGVTAGGVAESIIVDAVAFPPAS